MIIITLGVVKKVVGDMKQEWGVSDYIFKYSFLIWAIYF